MNEKYELFAEVILNYHNGDPEKTKKTIRDMMISKIYFLANNTIIVTPRPGVVIGVKGRMIEYLELKLGKITLIEDEKCETDKLLSAVDSLVMPDFDPNDLDNYFEILGLYDMECPCVICGKEAGLCECPECEMCETVGVPLLDGLCGYCCRYKTEEE